MTERINLEKKGWLVPGEKPFIERLTFESLEINKCPNVDPNNLETRNVVFASVLNTEVAPEPLSDILGGKESDDLLIAEIDRYGLPVRTIVNKKTGLVRTSPYYPNSWLNDFYKVHYRNLYSNNKSLSHSKILMEQIGRGNEYYQYISAYLTKEDKILEIGCGMGGILIPFVLNGHRVKGIDLGSEFIDLGNKFNLNLSNESLDSLVDKGEKYELIVLSHLIEHIPAIEKFFDQLKKVLNPKGKVFVAVPGLKMIHYTYNSDIQIYLQNAHCWSFSEKTLANFLNKVGFVVLKSDEHINCLAEIDSGNKIEFDLNLESEIIIEYLKETEKSFLNKNSLVRKIKNKLIRILN